VTTEQARRVTIAYEPVWAIGTGRKRDAGPGAGVHAAIRKILAQLHGGAVAEAIRIQYGGSVKPENAKEILAAADVDGALVGGASLKAEAFLGIAESQSLEIACENWKHKVAVFRKGRVQVEVLTVAGDDPAGAVSVAMIG